MGVVCSSYQRKETIMKTFKLFSDALSAFREFGGCMRYDTVDFVWAVGTYDEIEGMSSLSPKDQTERAMVWGGMTTKEIEEELSDWNYPDSPIYLAISKASDGPCSISGVGEELLDLWVSLGRPEPPSGPSTEIRIPISVEDMSIEGITDAENIDYNGLMLTLLEATGISYIGSGIWYTEYETGTDAWETYKEKSYRIVSDYIANDLWDNFCR